MLAYDEIITTSGVKIPFVPAIITPKIERPMRNNRYEGGECANLRRLLRPGDRVLELGAGVGLLSTVAGLVPGIESVTTIEANPDLIPLIRETHRLNGVTCVDLRNGVAAAEDGPEIDFYLRPDFWASSMEPDSRAFTRKVTLRRWGLRELVEEIRPTVIVCDIEGGEMGLFDAADLSSVRAMVVEFHPKVYG
jgi:FkbM family methyltransferase